MRKIAIIGAGLSRESAPYDEKGWEFWSMNNLYRSLPYEKFSRWYELHTFERVRRMTFGSKHKRRGVYRYGSIRVDSYMEAIAGLDIDVYMQKKWKLIPRSKLFPFKGIMRKYGKYFGCSFAWMIAHALYEHEVLGKTVDTIGLYGVELTGLEYYRQRPSTEYFVGLAEGKGIKIEIPAESYLLKMPFIYALDENFLTIDELYVNPPQAVNAMLQYFQEVIERKGI